MIGGERDRLGVGASIVALSPGWDGEGVGSCTNEVGVIRGIIWSRVREARVHVADRKGVAIITATEGVTLES